MFSIVRKKTSSLAKQTVSAVLSNALQCHAGSGDRNAAYAPHPTPLTPSPHPLLLHKLPPGVWERKQKISRPGEPEVFGFINAFDKSEQRARLERVQTLGGLAIPLCLRYLVASNRGGWTRGQTERDVSGKQLQGREKEREGDSWMRCCLHSDPIRSASVSK